MASPQLTLGIRLKDEATFDNFYVGKNAEIVTELMKSVRGVGERVIFLSNKGSEGCSHLLQAACHYANFHKVRSVYLPLLEFKQLPVEVLSGFENLDLICLDNIESIAKCPDWEETVFHLFNKVYDKGGRIIIGASDLPRSLPLALLDLQSRCAWGIVYTLKPLSDSEKMKVLILRAKERGIFLSQEVGKYILTHYPRQLGTLFSVFDLLDKASLSAHRKITIPFVKEVLKQHPF